MKRIFIFIHIFLLCLLVACDSENITLPSENNKLVGNIISRSNDKEALPEGSKILLNAYGGLTIKDEIFTNNNGTWTNNNGLEWKKVEETTYITALYPHDISNLYNEGTLKDILIAQDTLTQGEKDVTLTFRHLFASFILNVDETLVDKIKSIQLTSPQRVESISPVTGDITLSDIATPTILEGNGSDSYMFIIPPMEASITLNITLDNEISQSYKLQRHNFKSGFVYECGLRDWNTVPGIRSADDLIDFSEIINKKKEGDLFKYGERQADGRMLYRLLNDINFEGKSILPIGYYDGASVIFSDIFDGQGHTISNFTIPDKTINESVNKNYAGLFGYIGTKGIIKNLHIINAKTVSTTTCTYIGGIAAKNEGIIQNCSVQDSKLIYSNSTTETGIRIGGICASMSNGYIINTHSTNNTITTNKNGAIGGIIGDSCGDIINCYTYSNNFSAPNGAYAGGIAGTVSITNNLNLMNCYVLHFKAPENWGAIIGLLNNNTATFDNIFYNGGTLIAKNQTTTTPNIYLYQQFSYNKKHISIYLSEWIKTTGKNNYPDFIFYDWNKSNTEPYPAIFQ